MIFSLHVWKLTFIEENFKLLLEVYRDKIDGLSNFSMANALSS